MGVKADARGDYDYGSPVRKKVKGAHSKSAQAVSIESGAIVLNDVQYKHFKECMTSSPQPTKTLLEGAKLLEQLRQRRR